MTTRAAIPDRAGTHLKKHEKIFGTGKSRRQIGTLDPVQRIFQAGGEISNFLYKARMLISLPLDVWQQIALKVDYIELVDHEQNVCYRVPIGVAAANGTTYKNSLGERWGLHVRFWSCYDANWQLILKEWKAA